MLSPWRNRSASLVAVTILGLFLGCGRKTEVAGDAGVVNSQLQDIWGFYQLYLEEQKSPPTRIEDVEKYAIGFATGYDAVRTGDCIVRWGVATGDSGNANAVLAHQKEVPQQGGLVLLGNGTIKRMTAEEFQSAAKTK